MTLVNTTVAASRDRFGPFGGRYVPETLIPALDALDEAFDEVRHDAAFQSELDALLREYVGRPTALSFAPRLSERIGAPVWMKREDLCHTGAHKINNTVGQAMLALRMGKRRIIAETGAGQHGVATATICARFGLECVVYMGEEDMQRQALNVFRMRLLGATVIPVLSGTRTLKDATTEAIRDWVGSVNDSHYIIGSVVGPAPYPRMVREFQSVIGHEARAQMLSRAGRCRNRLSPVSAVVPTRWEYSPASWPTTGSSWLASKRLVRVWIPTGTARRSRVAPRGCCMVPSATCSRTPTGRSIRRIAFRRGSIIPVWVRSMRGCTIAAVPSTSR